MTMETIFGICVLRKLDDEEMTVRWPLVTCKIGPVFSIDARLGLSLLESFMDSRYICALIDLDVMRAPLRDDMLRKGEHLPGWIEWRFSSPPKENSDRFRQVIDNKRKYGGGGGSRTRVRNYLQQRAFMLFHVRFCLVIDAKNGRRRGDDQPD